MLQITAAGRIGNIAEVKEINSKDFTVFSLACNVFKKGEKVTQWARVYLAGKHPLLDHLKPGTIVCITGTPGFGAYQKDGKIVNTLSIFANSIDMLQGTKKEEKEASVPEQEPVPVAEQGDDLPF
jgi:Single-strand binding protein family.